MTNADKVHAINQLVGDHEMPTCWGFGKRRVKGAAFCCTPSPVPSRLVPSPCPSSRPIPSRHSTHARVGSCLSCRDALLLVSS